MSIYKDAVEITDSYFGGFLRFLGYRCVRCAAPLSGAPIYTFLVPSSDLEIAQQEWHDPQTTIQNPKLYAQNVMALQELSKKAKYCGGIASEKL